MTEGARQMESFWAGFEKEANATTDAFKGMAKAVKKPKAFDGVLDYAKMKPPAQPHAPTLDYSTINKIPTPKPAASTIDYSSPAMKAKPSGTSRPALSDTAQARLNHATKGKTSRTDWNEAIGR